MLKLFAVFLIIIIVMNSVGMFRVLRTFMKSMEIITIRYVCNIHVPPPRCEFPQLGVILLYSLDMKKSVYILF